MKWNFGKTGISLPMTWAAWKFRKITMGPLMLTPPDDTQGVLVVQVARASTKTIPGGKFRRRRGIGMARWRFSQGGLHRSRLIARRRKGWIVLFEAVSETSPTWPNQIVGQVARNLVPSGPAQSPQRRNAVWLQSFKWTFRRTQGCSIGIWVKGEPDSILVNGIHLIFYDSRGNAIHQALASDDTLLQSSSLIRSGKTRAAFGGLASPGDTYYFNHCDLLKTGEEPQRVRICVDGFSLTNWKNVSITRSVDLEVMPFSSIRSPLEGEWVCLNGPSPQSIHMDAVMTKRKKPFFPQQFAVDLVHRQDLLKPTGKSKNADYSGYGCAVHAVKDGIVSDAKNSVEDNKPGKRNYTDPEGNYSVIKHEQGLYSFYAHLKNRSVLVEKGQAVRAGQPIAQVGNSGNSTIPHLHFQFSEGREPLSSRSIPFLITGAGWPSTGLRVSSACRKKR